MHLWLFGSLGDEIAMTGAVRAVRQNYPDEQIIVNCRRPWIFDHNPHLEGGNGYETDPNRIFQLPLGGAPQEHMVDSYVRACGITPRDEYRRPELFLTDKELEVGRLISPGTIAIDTWAGWPSRRWPFDMWQAVVSELRESYPVIEIGASTPDCFGRRRTEILQDTDACYIDTFSVRETAGLLKGCALYLGQDSGLMHVAAAVGTPQVVVFGPKDSSLRAYSNTYPVNPGTGCNCEEVCNGFRNPCPTYVSVEEVVQEVGKRVEGY